MSKTDHKILYTDYIGTEEIRAKAAQNPDLWGREIPAVDFVWTPGAPLAQCAPAGTQFDYAIASHVMEHVPNPVGWLNEVLSVMKVGGRVALFLPDRRANADYFRQETQFHHLVQWWMEQPSVPTPGQILDFMVHSFSLRHGMLVDWSAPGGPVGVERAYSDAEALSTSTFVHNEGTYVDIHCTVWNAETFKAIFEHVVSAGLLNVSVGEVHGEDAEFVVVLTKLGEPKLTPPTKRVTFKEALAPKPFVTASPAPATSAEGFEGVNHQLAIVRNDLTFLVQLVANSTNYMKDLVGGAGSLPTAPPRRRDLIARARNWIRRNI